MEKLTKWASGTVRSRPAEAWYGCGAIELGRCHQLVKSRNYGNRFSGSVHVRGESSSASYVDDDGDSLTPDREKANRRCYAKLDLDLGVEEQFSSRVEHRVSVLEDRFREFGDAKDREENKRLKMELEETRLSRDRVEQHLYRMRVWAHGFYGEMVRVGAIREEGPSEAVDVLATLGETSPHEPRGSPRDSQ
ncbi:hypothetical protein Tco_0664875 [Tanacetum coccineum]